MNTAIFEVIFQETIADWEAGNITAGEAMDVMARLKRHWKPLEQLAIVYPAAERAPCRSCMPPD